MGQDIREILKAEAQETEVRIADRLHMGGFLGCGFGVSGSDHKRQKEEAERARQSEKAAKLKRRGEHGRAERQTD